MAKQTYEEALRRLLADEGGYSNDAGDPGGPTKYGITIGDVRLYVKKSATAEDVKNLTLDQAKSIYRSKYWDALNCDQLPPGVDYAVFDYGVNSGIGRAGRVLRRMVRVNDDDWRVNSEVLIAASRIEAPALVTRICDERLDFLKRLKTWPLFGKGWGRRVAGVEANGRRMAIGMTTRVEKATPKDKAKASGVGAAAVGAASVAAVGQHHWGFTQWALLAAGVIAVGVVVYFVVHHFTHANTSAKAFEPDVAPVLPDEVAQTPAAAAAVADLEQAVGKAAVASAVARVGRRNRKKPASKRKAPRKLVAKVKARKAKR